MNLLHTWCDLVDSHQDVEFARAVDKWLGYLKGRGEIADYRLTRRKLGLSSADVGEFHIVIEAVDLAQLDRAFDVAAAREGEAQRLHADVYARVTNARFALYRDFPDPVRAERE